MSIRWVKISKTLINVNVKSIFFLSLTEGQHAIILIVMQDFIYLFMFLISPWSS